MISSTQKPNSDKQFSMPKLIIVEGEDDAHFIFSLLKYIDKSYISKSWIHFLRGKYKLLEGSDDEFGLKDMINHDKFKNNVKDIAVIFDADDNLDQSFKEIIKDFEVVNLQESKKDSSSRKVRFNLPKKPNQFLENSSKPLNPNLSVFLLPNCKNKGALEDLYLSTLDKEEQKIIKDCIEGQLFSCLNGKELKFHKTKVKTQTFLSIKNKTLRDVGFAASKEKINFNSDSLGLLKKFLIKFINS